MDNLKDLPKHQKKVTAKVLVQEGYSLREVEDILGISDSSASRYAQEETPENLKEFEAKIAKVFRVHEHRIAAKALRRLDDIVPRARVNEALDVYKVMTGKDQKQGTNLNIMNKGEMELEFISNE